MTSKNADAIARYSVLCLKVFQISNKMSFRPSLKQSAGLVMKHVPVLAIFNTAVKVYCRV